MNTNLMRLLLSVAVSNLDAGASDRGVEVRLLFCRLAKLVSGANDVSEAGGVSSRFPGSDFTGVLEKCSKLARTSVCCKQKNKHYFSLKIFEQQKYNKQIFILFLFFSIFILLLNFFLFEEKIQF